MKQLDHILNADLLCLYSEKQGFWNGLSRGGGGVFIAREIFKY